MRILKIDLQYDYGIRERGKNYIGEDGFSGALTRLGHQVVPFYFDGYLDDTESLQTELLQAADKEKPNLIIFSMYRDEFKLETLNQLKTEYKTMAWFGDDSWRFDNFSKIYAPYFTYCVTTDKYALDKYIAIGQENVILSQWAAIDKYSPVNFDSQFDYEVSFVGGWNSYRQWFIDELRNGGIPVECFGYGWDNGMVPYEQMGGIFSRTKINLNISNSVSYDLRYLSDDIRYRLKNRKGLRQLPKQFGTIGRTLMNRQRSGNNTHSGKNSSQIKARNFEIPYFGGFQLTDYVPALEDYLTVGSEVVCYKDVDEARMLIRYYLKHDEEREKIKLQAHCRVVNEHTYCKRWEQILAQID